MAVVQQAGPATQQGIHPNIHWRVCAICTICSDTHLQSHTRIQQQVAGGGHQHPCFRNNIHDHPQTQLPGGRNRAQACKKTQLRSRHQTGLSCAISQAWNGDLLKVIPTKGVGLQGGRGALHPDEMLSRAPYSSYLLGADEIYVAAVLTQIIPCPVHARCPRYEYTAVTTTVAVPGREDLNDGRQCTVARHAPYNQQKGTAAKAGPLLGLAAVLQCVEARITIHNSSEQLTLTQAVSHPEQSQTTKCWHCGHIALASRPNSFVFSVVCCVATTINQPGLHCKTGPKAKGPGRNLASTCKTSHHTRPMGASARAEPPLLKLGT